MESNSLGLLLAPLLLDLLGLLRLTLLLLYTLALGLVPIGLGLHEVPLESDFLIEVYALSDSGGTMSVVLPWGPSQSFRLICGPFLSMPCLRFSRNWMVFSGVRSS